ncbi:MAG: DNA alkylation repair protein [Alphaproteobacteria bacterium]
MTTVRALPRKGATKPSAVPPDILRRLNRGEIETANLAEGLAVDFVALLGEIVPPLKKSAAPHFTAAPGIVRRMAIAAELLLDHKGKRGIDELQRHPADTVRGWAAFMIGLTPNLSLRERLKKMKPLADDPHFGVREWAWLALRTHIATDAVEAISLLRPWTSDSSANIRRFAVESTRPRGVWCTHIDILKRQPKKALPLLEPLRDDPAIYVQNSVGNWLNDAGKSSPEFVTTLCRRWMKESMAPATLRIVKRAQRSLATPVALPPQTHSSVSNRRLKSKLV